MNNYTIFRRVQAVSEPRNTQKVAGTFPGKVPATFFGLWLPAVAADERDEHAGLALLLLEAIAEPVDDGQVLIA
jgi:hypothetical protein